MEPLDALDLARSEFERRLRAVRPDQWDNPTPCEGWTVRTLVNHIVGGHRVAVMLLGGIRWDEAFAAIPRDTLGDDPVATFGLGFDEMAATFRQPEALERTCHHVAGDISGEQLLGMRVGELSIHSWDLARGIGGDDTLDPGLVQGRWDAMAPMAGSIGKSGFFGSGPSGQVGEDAPLQTRLLDLTGRRP